MMNQEAFVQLIVQKVMERIGKEAWYVPEPEQNESFIAYLLETAGDQVRLVDSANEAEVVCLPQTSAKLFAEVAKGYGDLPHTEEILTHLAKGKKVCILEEGIPYRKHAATCPEKLYEKWLSYEAVAMSYGVRIVNREALFSSKGACLSKNTVDSGVCQINQRIITEKVLSLIPNRNAQRIEILTDAIVTPLAQDYIRQEQLHIKRVSERS